LLFTHAHAHLISRTEGLLESKRRRCVPLSGVSFNKWTLEVVWTNLDLHNRKRGQVFESNTFT